MRFFLFLTFFISSLLLFAYNANALSITPTRYAVTLEPGAEHQVTITIINDSATAANLKTLIEPFSIDTVTGRPLFGGSDDAVAWIDISPRKFALGPGEQTTITFAIRIPKDAEPGAHYLGLFAQSQSSAGTGITAGSKIGSLLFLYVAGDARESLVRRSFLSTQRLYFFSSPTISLDVINDGTIHVVPTGDIVLWDMWDRKIDSVSVNPKNIKVFPRTSFHRFFTYKDLSSAVVGPVTAYATLQYGLTNQTMTATTTFWMIPVPLVVAVVVVFLCIYFIFFYRRLRTKV